MPDVYLSSFDFLEYRSLHIGIPNFPEGWGDGGGQARFWCSSSLLSSLDSQANGVEGMQYVHCH